MTYHYYAEVRQTSIDGIVQVSTPIRTMKDYRYVKQLISEHFSCDPKQMVIKSLSALP